ncbi:MAG: class A beta-lactamase-related serine hydrolase, partial [Sphingobacteriia bacterium]
KKKNRKGRWVKHTVYVKDPISVTGMSTNEDVLNYYIQHKPSVEANPDRRYSYCNTNYALLALVVERVTGQSFPQYLKENLFGPLGMEDSYVFSLADTARYVPSYQYNKRPYPLEKLDAVYGDKNVYSTVRDLLKWDRALYQGTYVSLETLEQSFEPQSHEHGGVRNYGYGWHLMVDPNAPKVVYHNGWWHGNNAAFRRLINDTATIIVLGNKFNPNIWRAGNMGIVFNALADTSEPAE